VTRINFDQVEKLFALKTKAPVTTAASEALPGDTGAKRGKRENGKSSDKVSLHRLDVKQYCFLKKVFFVRCYDFFLMK